MQYPKYDLVAARKHTLDALALAQLAAHAMRDAHSRLGDAAEAGELGPVLCDAHELMRHLPSPERFEALAARLESARVAPSPDYHPLAGLPSL